MKAYRILLSLVLCLALVLGMACASAEPLLDAGLTLSNVSINYNGTELTLPYELRLDAALEDAAAKLHFELGKDDSVFLPVSGEIDESAVRFSLGNSGRVYVLDMGMLLEEVGLDADGEEFPITLQMLEQMGDHITALAAAQKDPQKLEQLWGVAEKAMAVMTGSEGEETAVTIGNKGYMARKYEGSVTAKSLTASMDILFNTGVEEYDAYMQMLMDVMNVSMGTQYTNYSDLMAASGVDLESEEANEPVMDVEMIIGGDAEVIYEKAVMTAAPEEGVEIEITVEDILTPDGADGSMAVSGGDAYSPIDAQFSYHADLAEGKPTAIQGSLKFDGGYDDSDETYLDYDFYTLDAQLTGAVEGGLWSGDLSVNYANEYGWGEVEDADIYEEAIAFTGSYAERAETDGSVTSAIALNLAHDDQTYGLGFDLNVAASEGLADLFGAGAREYILSEDDYDLPYDMLEIDAASLSADAMELTLDDSFTGLLEIYEEMTYVGYEEYDYEEYEDYSYDYDEDYSYADAYTEEYTYDDEYAYDYEEEYVYEEEIPAEISYTTVYSIEEADEIYGGVIPAYAAPEGYVLNYVDVDAGSIYADYSNAEDQHIGMMMIYFGVDLGADAAEISYYEDENGDVYAAELFMGSDYIMFQFDSVPMEQAELILSGLAQ